MWYNPSDKEALWIDSGFINSIISFAQNNTVIAIVFALFLLFFMYRRPKLFFGLLFFGLLPGGIVLHDHEHGGDGLGTETKADSRRGKAVSVECALAHRQKRSGCFF